MTVLALATIPNTINSYERLAVWALQCLQNTTNGDTLIVVEGQGTQAKAQVQLGLVADGSYRFILSAYVPCDQAALNSATAKTWMAAQDLSTAVPHANLLSN
jgi:hypothetical protein